MLELQAGTATVKVQAASASGSAVGNHSTAVSGGGTGGLARATTSIARKPAAYRSWSYGNPEQ